jgi:GNAT superfamily N-acetyltransferase
MPPDASAAVGHLPALYMVWDPDAPRRAATLPAGYALAAVHSTNIDAMRTVIELDGALSDHQWSAFADRVLPDGLFAVSVTETAQAVGTVAAVHEPHGGRFHFPGGGQIGYLVVNPVHRGHRLGLGLVTAAVVRLLDAGYRTIWLGVQDHRLPAICTYLHAGFVPFLHAPDPDALESRWRSVFRSLSPAPAMGICRSELPEIQ